MAILDIELGHGTPSGIDALKWLRAQGFSGRCYFLTGHGQTHPLVTEAIALGQVKVLAKPMKTENILRFLEA